MKYKWKMKLIVCIHQYITKTRILSEMTDFWLTLNLHDEKRAKTHFPAFRSTRLFQSHLIIYLIFNNFPFRDKFVLSVLCPVKIFGPRTGQRTKKIAWGRELTHEVYTWQTCVEQKFFSNSNKLFFKFELELEQKPRTFRTRTSNSNTFINICYGLIWFSAAFEQGRPHLNKKPKE